MRKLFWAPIALGLLLSQLVFADVVKGDIHIARPGHLRNVFMEDMQRDRPGMPYRFALPYSPGGTATLTQGQWTPGQNGTQIWTLKITADDSTSLNIGFSQFSLPRSAQLVIGTLDGREQLRTLTARDNARNGQFWTPPLDGNGVFLQMRVASSERSAVRLQIGVINYGYRDMVRNQNRAISRGSSGSCNIDVVCNQEPMWNDPINSVAAITVNGSDTCTGSLLNNTAGDRRLLFLTAAHCRIGPNNAASVVAIWNYQNSTCRPPNSVQSGQMGNGERKQFSSGSTFRAGNAKSDFTLIELNGQIDPAWNLFWSGWDRSGVETPSMTGIHHPAVAEKRISFSALPSTTTKYLGNDIPGDGTHVRVTRWTAGTTEPGSSGSPLFDANRRVIGQLHGGYAACNAQDTSDWYGRLSTSWEGGGTVDSALKTWLDPINAGVPAIDGMNLQGRRR